MMKRHKPGIRTLTATAVTLGTTALLMTGSAPSSGSVRSAAGFVPSSTSWPAAQQGWVLGFTSCSAGTCPSLLRTADGGESWQRRPAPPVTVPATGEQVRVFFANGTDGLVTDGHRLFATHDAWHWAPVALPGSPATVAVGALAANHRYAYAVLVLGTSDAAQTRLYAAPLSGDDWRAVPGVAVGGSGDGDVAARGRTGVAALGVPFESSRYWVTTNGRSWRERTAPCSPDAVTRLDDPPTGGVFALCSSDPGFGDQTKELKVARPGAGFASLGEAPRPGITTDFAASPAAALVAASGRGDTTWIHATFDGGRTWVDPLVLPGNPISDLAFSDAQHAVALYGGPQSSDAAVYRSVDAGHTWSRLTVVIPG
jgi:photosystem II stability/assembly factor-like uncharacterized protein